MIVSSSINHYYWGLLPYLEADLLQSEAWAQVKSGGSGLVLGGEVHHVVTQGVRAKIDHVIESGLAPVTTRRGGETTLHSPGQLVIYPVLSLREYDMGVKSYVETLLKVSEKTFRDFDIPVEMRWDPLGLWTHKGKLGFCGVQVKMGITQHGLALNISNNLDLFSQIVSCGLSNASYDRAQNYNETLTLEDFFYHWVANFSQSVQVELALNP